MKEIKEIIKAFDQAQIEGKQTALATVVQVEGSSYRSPGARMLITEDGALTGAISGGCLEGDALRKAQLVMFQQQSMLVTYDTTDDDDAKFGVGLGCNGIIHILIEPIDTTQEDHPLSLLKSCLKDRADRVLVTFFDLKNKRAPQLGTCLLWNKNKIAGSWTGLEDLKPILLKDVEKAFSSGHSLIKSYPEKKGITAFIELIKAPVALVILGAGNDAIPLVNLAHVLGWEITIIDGRASHATLERFPTVKNLILSKADKVADSLSWDKRTVVVLMTHNYSYDLTVLKQLLPLRVSYLGVLGPKKKMMKMLDALEKEGIPLLEEYMSKIFGPIGLDIGAEAPEEIALSVLAEIKAILEDKPGTFLRDKTGPIHSDDGIRLNLSDAKYY
ncbi:MAG: XdhC/CoxI family protein [Anditalea sp.]